MVVRSNHPGTSREGQDEVGEVGPALDGHCNCLWPQPFSSCTSVARQSSLTAWVLKVMPTVIWGTTEKPRERKCDKKLPRATTIRTGIRILVFSTWKHHMLCALAKHNALWLEDFSCVLAWKQGLDCAWKQMNGLWVDRPCGKLEMPRRAGG